MMAVNMCVYNSDKPRQLFRSLAGSATDPSNKFSGSLQPLANMPGLSILWGSYNNVRNVWIAWSGRGGPVEL